MKAGWSIERLGHAAKFVDYRGKTPPKTAEGIRLITAKNVKMGFVQRHPIEYIDPAAYNGWMTRGFPEYGDVLFTTEAPLGNVAQLDTREKVVIGQRLITLKTDVNRTDPTFLKYALLSPQVQAEIHSRATGATVQGIKASLLKQVPIPLPPLEEQQRIVAVLDEAFEGLARARAHAEANLKNAWELFDAALRTYFTDGASGWSTAHLKDVCLDFGRGKSKHRPRNDASLYGGEVPFVQTGDISKADHFIKEYSQTYSKRGLAQSKLWPRGTVCVAIKVSTPDSISVAMNARFCDSRSSLEITCFAFALRQASNACASLGRSLCLGVCV